MDIKRLIPDYECTKFPNGNWKHCCVQHDIDYESGVDKWEADLKLALCVLKKGHVIISPLMWLGVTIFGWGPYNKHKKYRRQEND